MALALGIWSVRRQNVRLRERTETLESENAKYRNELGILEITDPSQIHAIRLERKTGSDVSQYRVYLPKGRAYELKYSYAPIPKTGLPKPTGSIHLSPGESLIDFAIEPQYDHKTGETTSSATAELNIRGEDQSHSGATIGLSEHHNDWIRNKETGGFFYERNEIGRKFELSAADKPLVLFRIRAKKCIPLQRNASGKATSYSAEEIAEPCDGFMAWIEVID